MTSELASNAKFQLGDEVFVLDLGKLGHVRIPFYIRGKTGLIIQHCGVYLNPEDLAVGVTSGPVVNLYRVAFSQRALWPEDNHREGDQLIIEIYEHWLRMSEQIPHSTTGGKD